MCVCVLVQRIAVVNVLRFFNVYVCLLFAFMPCCRTVCVVVTLAQRVVHKSPLCFGQPLLWMARVGGLCPVWTLAMMPTVIYVTYVVVVAFVVVCCILWADMENKKKTTTPRPTSLKHMFHVIKPFIWRSWKLSLLKWKPVVLIYADSREWN